MFNLFNLTTFNGIVGFSLTLILGITIILWLIKTSIDIDDRDIQKLKLLGYEDIMDVKIFLELVDCSIYKFVNSKSLRQYYDKYRKGEMTCIK